MDIQLFRRGIVLPQRAAARTVSNIPPPKRVSLLLRYCACLPCKPVVKEGAKVKVGQLVAAGSDSDLHASISGIVSGFEELRLPDGSKSQSMLIDGDGSDAREEPNLDDSPLAHKPHVLLERIRRAGILRTGTETLPLATVIGRAQSPHGYIPITGEPITGAIQHLIIRFTDIDPHLATLDAVTSGMGDDISELALGVEALSIICRVGQVHFALDKKQRVAAVETLADENEYGLIRVNARNYPMASDAALGLAASGREPEVGCRKVYESGVLVINLDTVLQVARAVRERAPVIDRCLTLTSADRTVVLRAPLGTRLSDLVEAAGMAGDHGKIVLGGPMRGLAYHTLDFPLHKGLVGVALFEPDQIAPAVNGPCISCGLCAMTCPIRLVPGMLSRFCEYGQWQQAEAVQIFSCIECGCCAYVCPAGRSLVQLFVHAKNELLAMRRAIG